MVILCQIENYTNMNTYTYTYIICIYKLRHQWQILLQLYLFSGNNFVANQSKYSCSAGKCEINISVKYIFTKDEYQEMCHCNNVKQLITIQWKWFSDEDVFQSKWNYFHFSVNYKFFEERETMFLLLLHSTKEICWTSYYSFDIFVI